MNRPLNQTEVSPANAIQRFFRKIYADFATSREREANAREEAMQKARTEAAERHKAWLRDLSNQRDAENEKKIRIATLRNEDNDLRTQAGGLAKDLVEMAKELAEQNATLEVALLTDTATAQLESSVKGRCDQLRGYIRTTKNRLSELRTKQEAVQAKIAAAMR